MVEKKKKSLKQRIEVLSSTIQSAQTSAKDNDHLDHDLSSHVEHFITEPLPKLEEFSLATKEQALEAIEIIAKTQQELNKKIQTAKALRTLLNTRK